MGVKKGLAGAKLAVANTLSSNFNAQIDAVWTSWADYDATQTNAGNPTAPKTYPVNIYMGYREEVPEYPALVVSGVESRVVGDASGNAAGWNTVEHRIEVACLIQSDNQWILDEMTDRYLVALWETIQLNQGLDGSLAGLSGAGIVRTGKSQIYKQGTSHFFIQAGGAEIVVYMDESL